MNIKRLTSILMIFLIIVSSPASLLLAEELETRSGVYEGKDGKYWYIDDTIYNGGVCIIKFEKNYNTQYIDIPDKIDGKDVTTLGYPRKSGDVETDQPLPEGVFTNKGLRFVHLPENLRRISEGAFIENDLEGIDFPKTLEVIENAAFIRSGLTEVKFNEGLKRIDQNAFIDSGLKGEIHFPKSVEMVGDYAFANNQIRSVTWEDDGNLHLKGGAFQNNRIGGYLDLKGGIKKIGSETFADNPNAVVNIGKQFEAFYMPGEEKSPFSVDSTNRIVNYSTGDIFPNAVRGLEQISTVVGYEKDRAGVEEELGKGYFKNFVELNDLSMYFEGKKINEVTDKIENVKIVLEGQVNEYEDRIIDTTINLDTFGAEYFKVDEVTGSICETELKDFHISNDGRVKITLPTDHEYPKGGADESDENKKVGPKKFKIVVEGKIILDNLKASNVNNLDIKGEVLEVSTGSGSNKILDNYKEELTESVDFVFDQEAGMAHYLVIYKNAIDEELDRVSGSKLVGKTLRPIIKSFSGYVFKEMLPSNEGIVITEDGKNVMEVIYEFKKPSKPSQEPVDYTITHRLEDGTLISKEKGVGVVGQTIVGSSIASDKYKLLNTEPSLGQIRLSKKADNIIKYVYKERITEEEKESRDYSIIYKVKDGGKILSKIEAEAKIGDKVKGELKKFKGYKFLEVVPKEEEIVIKEKGKNQIIYYFEDLRESLLNKDDHMPFMTGYPDSSFRANGDLTREEAATVFYNILDRDYKATIESDTPKFSDVKKNRWSAGFIATLAKGEILSGYRDGTFRPAGKITRAELATILAQFEHIDEGANRKFKRFNDVQGHWAEKNIDIAHEKGWIEGYPDGSFRPDKNITRAEFTTMVNAILERSVKRENLLEGIRKFTDIKGSEWYYLQVVEATNGHDFDIIKDDEIWTELWK